MHVTEAATIADALDAIGRMGDSLALAVLDYFLPPGEPGNAWCRAALERSIAPPTAEVITDVMAHLRVGAPVLFITGHTRGAMHQVLARTNAFGCLHKPFSSRVLLDVLDRMHRLHVDRTSLLDALSCTDEPTELRDAVFRAALHLAKFAPDAHDEMSRVLRVAIDGLDIEAACKACGMSRAKYNRKKSELRVALGIANFGGALLRRIDRAVSDGDLPPFRIASRRTEADD